mmetsp:Transcript_1075/g.2600  ORF Transcript_1075/g.2600 Transcript_1075/m.2600 type:complete len:148 (-) Transcript_1075:559-1002(-)
MPVRPTSHLPLHYTISQTAKQLQEFSQFLSHIRSHDFRSQHIALPRRPLLHFQEAGILRGKESDLPGLACNSRRQRGLEELSSEFGCRTTAKINRRESVSRQITGTPWARAFIPTPRQQGNILRPVAKSVLQHRMLLVCEILGLLGG